MRRDILALKSYQVAWHSPFEFLKELTIYVIRPVSIYVGIIEWSWVGCEELCRSRRMYPPRLKAEVDNITSSEFNNCFILFLSKKYTTTRNTIVWGLLCLLGMLFDTETTNSNFFNNHVNSTSIIDHWKDIGALPSKGEGKNPHHHIQRYIRLGRGWGREGKDKTCFCRLCQVRRKPRGIDRSLRGFPKCSIWCTPTEIPEPTYKRLD